MFSIRIPTYAVGCVSNDVSACFSKYGLKRCLNVVSMCVSDVVSNFVLIEVSNRAPNYVSNCVYNCVAQVVSNCVSTYVSNSVSVYVSIWVLSSNWHCGSNYVSGCASNKHCFELCFNLCFMICFSLFQPLIHTVFQIMVQVVLQISNASNHFSIGVSTSASNCLQLAFLFSLSSFPLRR